MKNGFFAVVFLMFSFGSLHSQENQKFIYYDNLNDTLSLKLDYAYAGNHFLGNQIANKFYRFQQTYTYIEKGSPSSPSDKTIVQKPVIFYAVNKLNPYFKNEIKKGVISKEEATKHLGRILDLAYVIFHQNTVDFEAYLRGHKKPADTIRAFDMIELD